MSGDGVDPWRRSGNGCSFSVWWCSISCLWKHSDGYYSVSPWHSGISQVRNCVADHIAHRWFQMKTQNGTINSITVTIFTFSEMIFDFWQSKASFLTFPVPKHWRWTRPGQLGFHGSASSSEMGAGKHWGLWWRSTNRHSCWRVCGRHQCIHTGKKKNKYSLEENVPNTHLHI